MSEKISAIDHAEVSDRQRHPSPLEAGARFALVVDDDPLIRNTWKTLLQYRGFVVITAFDGLEAVEIAPLFPFSLIVTDVEMPRLDGVEAVRRIRAMGGSLAEVAIVVSSGRAAMEGLFEDSLAIELFLPKGCDLSPLFELLNGMAPDPDHAHVCAGTC